MKPSFPFEIARRDGRMTREIMCRRCAGWTAFDGDMWRHTDGTPACVQPDAFHNNNNGGRKMNKTEEQARTDRILAAEREWAELRTWQQKGEVGERPATPTLDEAQDGAFKPLRTGTTRTKGVKAPKQSEPLIFTINGKPVREKVNAFGELSWSGTANLVGDSKRIKPAELVAILEEQFEITNPRFTAWGPITLANGVTLQVCAVDADGQPVGLATAETARIIAKGQKSTKATKAAEKLAEPIVEAPAVESKPKRVRPSRSKAAVAERAAAKNRKAS